MNLLSFLSSFDKKPNSTLSMLAEIMTLMVILQVATLCYMMSKSENRGNRGGHRSPRTPRSRSTSRRRSRSSSPAASSSRARQRNNPQLSLEDAPRSHGSQSQGDAPPVPPPNELQARYNHYKGRTLLSVASTGKVHLTTCSTLRRGTKTDETFLCSACFPRGILDINKFALKVGIQNQVCHAVDSADQCECPRWGPVAIRACCKVCLPPYPTPPKQPTGVGAGSHGQPDLQS